MEYLLSRLFHIHVHMIRTTIRLTYKTLRFLTINALNRGFGLYTGTPYDGHLYYAPDAIWRGFQGEVKVGGLTSHFSNVKNEEEMEKVDVSIERWDDVDEKILYGSFDIECDECGDEETVAIWVDRKWERDWIERFVGGTPLCDTCLDKRVLIENMA